MATSSVSGIGSISSAGIGSGLDVNSIITQLMAVESQPLTLLQNQATSLKSELSTYGSMKSQYATLRDKANALLAPTLWSATTATSDDTGSVKVASTSNAQTGSYSVAVSRLATTQTLTSTAVASPGATLGEGTLTIELGSWSSDATPAFTAKSGSAPATVTIGPGDTSLAAIRDKINAAGAGVTASIITDASGARLSLRSTDTGAENGFRITAAESVDDGDPATGLSMLGYDAAAGSSPMGLAQSATNAAATINGIAISSARNTLSNVVDGLTLTLVKPTATAVNVGVATDTNAIKTAITDFVTAFNGLASFIRTETAYDSGSKTGGPLQGDQATLALQSQLRSVINQPSSASSTWSVLSQIGISMQADGTLAADSTKLDNALGNLPELKKLLYADGPDSASSGFVRRFKRIADAALSMDGVFAARNAGINASLQRNGKAQDDMQTRLDATQARLRAQYTALDAQMSQLNGLNSYVTQQIAAMTKSRD